MSSPLYSIVIPVYNRPQELDELLSSLLGQSFKNFEVIIIEDGSSIRCDYVVDKYRNALSIQYFIKPNSGPGPSRNLGFSHARGEYFVVFDSDCIIPPHYFNAVNESLHEYQWDAWGGPDRAHENFSIVQRAMGYTMSSVLTTGGIRGGAKRLGWFQPRSFNMGMKRKVFEATGGFKFARSAEDIELSINMKKAGFKIGLIKDAFVYHKRRTNLKQFYHQVFNFGRGRAMVGEIHPEEVKLTHWFPSFFLIGTVSILVLPLFSTALFSIGICLFTLYVLAIFFHSLTETKHIGVALLSIPSALLQLYGYGAGFLNEKFKIQRR